MTKVFSVRFDERTKQILIALLDNAISQTSTSITAGDYSDELLNQHEELTQVKSGLLYTKPEEVELSSPPEATTEVVKESSTDQTGGVEMYKSQGRSQ